MIFYDILCVRKGSTGIPSSRRRDTDALAMLSHLSEIRDQIHPD
jgi:hypothetical protein